MHRETRPGVWEIVVYVGTDPATGKEIRRSRTVHGTERTAIRAEGKLRTELAAANRPTSALTMGDLLDRWLDNADLEASTRQQCGRYITNQIRPTLGPVPVGDLTVERVDRFNRALERSGALNGGPLAPSTVVRIHGIVRAALEQARVWGWVERNVASDARAPSVPPADPQPPDLDVVRKLLTVASELDPDLRVYLRVAANSGNRKGETLALRLDTINLDAGTVQKKYAVKQAAGAPYIGPTKTKKRHQIALGPTTTLELRAHVARLHERATHFGITLKPSALVFSDTPDCTRPWRPDAVSKRFARIRAAAGIEGVEMRTLRHWVATTLLNDGFSGGIVSPRLSHARTSTTNDIYEAWLPAPDHAAGAHLDTLLDG